MDPGATPGCWKSAASRPRVFCCSCQLRCGLHRRLEDAVPLRMGIKPDLAAARRPRHRQREHHVARHLTYRIGIVGQPHRQRDRMEPRRPACPLPSSSSSVRSPCSRSTSLLSSRARIPPRAVRLLCTASGADGVIGNPAPSSPVAPCATDMRRRTPCPRIADKCCSA